MQAATLSNRKLSTAKQRVEQPRKLSRTGQWMKDHPNGIFEIIDRRAVNK